ncbi:MAG UNVERIFIED_CONTAM: hypothetical protein LVR18_15855 [Planctomycetaceae bacterium]
MPGAFIVRQKLPLLSIFLPAFAGACMTLSQLKSLLRRIFQPGKTPSNPALRRLKMLRLEDRRVFNASLALTGVQLVGGENLFVSNGGQQDVGSGTSVEQSDWKLPKAPGPSTVASQTPSMICSQVTKYCCSMRSSS